MGMQITEYFFYRWRYIVGYGLLGLAFLGMLIVAGIFIPGGLSATEVDSVIKSSTLSITIHSFDPQWVINLPYHVLQRVSIELFGVSQLSIKLPSLILGALSIAGMILLLRMWFRHNIALITTALIVTTGQFLFVAQTGAAGIVYMFWSIWLLVFAMLISNRVPFGFWWKLLLFITAALSLYTPLSLYILIALVSAAILHPHLRYIIKHLSKVKLTFALLLSAALLIPLGYALIKQPSLLFTLLGIPSEWPDLRANFIQLIKQYFDFISPQYSALFVPIYGAGSLILILLGIMRLFTTKYTARSYVISAWIILLVPVLILNPSFTSVTFVPALLLMGMGIETLLRTWYQLFPRNPYARIAGLIPLIILIGGMLLSGLGRYTYAYLYDPNLVSHFSKDLRVVNKVLSEPDRGRTLLVVTNEELPFYTIVATHNKNVSATSIPAPSPGGTTIVSHNAQPDATALGEPYRIYTDALALNADRFYTYKTDQK